MVFSRQRPPPPEPNCEFSEPLASAIGVLSVRGWGGKILISLCTDALLYCLVWSKWWLTRCLAVPAAVVVACLNVPCVQLPLDKKTGQLESMKAETIGLSDGFIFVDGTFNSNGIVVRMIIFLRGGGDFQAPFVLENVCNTRELRWWLLRGRILFIELVHVLLFSQPKIKLQEIYTRDVSKTIPRCAWGMNLLLYTTGYGDQTFGCKVIIMAMYIQYSWLPVYSYFVPSLTVTIWPCACLFVIFYINERSSMDPSFNGVFILSNTKPTPPHTHTHPDTAYLRYATLF